MRTYDLISTIVYFSLGIAVIFGGFQMEFGEWQNPGQGFMPVLAGSLLSFLSAICLIFTVIKKTRIDEFKSFFATEKSFQNVFFTLLPLILYALFLNFFGFLLTTFFFLLFLFRVIKPQGWPRALITSLIVSIVSFFLFEILLAVQFPQGIFLNVYRIKTWIF